MSFQDIASHCAVDALLHRVSQELAGCRSLLVKVETAVETLLQSGNIAADDPLHIIEMQNIDLLDQILADLMLFLQDISASDPIIDAQTISMSQVVRRIRLAALRNRLTGLACAPDDSNGVELF